MLRLRPVIEMMTFNYAILALDQIVNTAAKMLRGRQYNIPRRAGPRPSGASRPSTPRA